MELFVVDTETKSTLENIKAHLDKGEAFHKELVLQLLSIVEKLSNRVTYLEEDHFNSMNDGK